VKARDFKEREVSGRSFKVVYILINSGSLSGFMWFIESFCRVRCWAGVRHVSIGSGDRGGRGGGGGARAGLAAGAGAGTGVAVAVAVDGDGCIVSFSVRSECLDSAAERAVCAGAHLS